MSPSDSSREEPGLLAPHPALDLVEIWKSFPGVMANAGVSLAVQPGTIHGVVGENGAGKTTLMKIAYGLYQADQGEIRMNGQKTRFQTAHDAIEHGMGMVQQHFTLVPSLSVAENAALGEASLRNLLDLQRTAVAIGLLAEQYELGVNSRARIRELSMGERQRAEILRALYRGAQILILDEPTAILTPREAQHLFGVLRGLAAEGKSVVFISHKLPEVMSVTDVVTVMRNGQVVGEVQTTKTSEGELARMMVGQDLIRRRSSVARPERGPLVLDVRRLAATNERGQPAFADITFRVHAGEIVGVAGVAGNGQEELVEAVTGLRGITAGVIELNGHDITGVGVHERRRMGMAHVPEDRHARGAAASLPVQDNAVLGAHRLWPLARGQWRRLRAVRHRTHELLKRFQIRISNPASLTSTLSGGNQQRLVMARELSSDPRVLIASQPTRGIDIGGAEYLRSLLSELRERGCAILLVSAELDEIMDLSDRIIVFYKGQIVGELDTDYANEGRIGELMSGVTSPRPKRRP